MTVQRWPIVVLAAGLLAGALAFEGDPTTSSPPVLGAVDAAGAVAAVADDDALTSTWFCAGGTAVPGGAADHTVLITNLGDEAVEATVDVMGSEGQSGRSQVSVDAGRTASVRVGDLVEAAWAGAAVEAPGGSILVEHRVAGPAGRDQSRCTPNPSDTWHFAYGRTSLGSSMWLAILNPFPDRAVADVAFDTEDGYSAPQGLQGLLVPARSVKIVDVGEYARRSELLSTTITLRSGRVVVDRVQVLGREDGSTLGLDVETGVVEPATDWYFAEGRVGPQLSEMLVIFNPSEERATVDVVVRPSAGSAAGPIEPFEVAIAPRHRQAIVLDAENRVPKPLEHATIVQSFNGVPVVVERVTIGGAPELVVSGSDGGDTAGPADGSTTDTTVPDGGGTSDGTTGDAATETALDPASIETQAAPLPGSGPGFSVQAASPVASTDLVAVVPTGQEVWLSLLNPGGDAVEVDIELRNADGEQQLLGDAVTVEPADRLEVRVDLPDASDPAIVIVRAASPIVVDQGVVWNDGVGPPDLSNQALAPRAGTTSVPDASGLTAPQVSDPG